MAKNGFRTFDFRDVERLISFIAAKYNGHLTSSVSEDYLDTSRTLGSVVPRGGLGGASAWRPQAGARHAGAAAGGVSAERDVGARLQRRGPIHPRGACRRDRHLAAGCAGRPCARSDRGGAGHPAILVPAVSGIIANRPYAYLRGTLPLEQEYRGWFARSRK
jgi:hypothetical protein